MSFARRVYSVEELAALRVGRDGAARRLRRGRGALRPDRHPAGAVRGGAVLSGPRCRCRRGRPAPLDAVRPPRRSRQRRGRRGSRRFARRPRRCGWRESSPSPSPSRRAGRSKSRSSPTSGILSSSSFKDAGGPACRRARSAPALGAVHLAPEPHPVRAKHDRHPNRPQAKGSQIGRRRAGVRDTHNQAADRPERPGQPRI